MPIKTICICLTGLGFILSIVLSLEWIVLSAAALLTASRGKSILGWGTFCLASLFLFWRLSAPIGPTRQCEPRSQPIVVTEARVPYFFNPPSIVRTCKKAGAYEFTAAHDSIGRRIVGAGSLIVKPNAKQVIAAGCSFTYGVGVNQGLSFSDQLQALSSDISVVNLGYPSGGLQYVFAYLLDLKRLVPDLKDDPIFIYTVIPDHIRRFSHLDEWSFHDWSGGDPILKIESNGDYSYEGTLAQRPLVKWMKRQLTNSMLADLMILNEVFRKYKKTYFSTAQSDDKYKTATNVYIKALNGFISTFYRLYPRGKLFIYYWNGSMPQNNIEASNGIRNLLLAGLDKRAEFLFHPEYLTSLGTKDSPDHPDAEAHKKTALFLWKHLKNLRQ